MSLRTMMNAIRKKTESESYSDSKYLKPSGYIDTGCYAVNRIISGNIYKGIPEGRITTFFGESGCVPENRNIKILVKVNNKNATFLTSHIGYSASEYTCSYKEKISWLETIGYSLSQIAKETFISRQTLTKIKNNSIKDIRYATKAKIDSYIDRNTYNTLIGNVDKLLASSENILVSTPKGYSKCGHIIRKGLKECLEIVTTSHISIASTDHMFQNGNVEWVFAENLLVNDTLLTDKGVESIVDIVNKGLIECVDIELFNEDHTYFIDGISSHNSGKSRIVAQIIINALTKNNYDVIFYFDSEGGALFDLIKNSGCDVSKIEHVLVANTEEATVKMLNIYAEIAAEIKNINEKNEAITEKNDKNKKKILAGEMIAEPLEVAPKVLCVLDSFGMLVSNKLLTDATEKDKMVSDMGSQARGKNNFIKAMTIPVLKTNAALIVINHIYDDPSAMYTSKIKNQPGGKGLHFASCVIVQSTKTLEKDKVDGLTEGESYFKGNMIKYFTIKNRLVKLGYEAEMFVDLNYGISKYDGLVEEAKRYGFITGGAKGRYLVPTYSDKSVTMSEILTNDDIWNTFIAEFNEKSEKDMQYGSDIDRIMQNKLVDDAVGAPEEEDDTDSDISAAEDLA